MSSTLDRFAAAQAFHPFYHLMHALKPTRIVATIASTDLLLSAVFEGDTPVPDLHACLQHSRARTEAFRKSRDLVKGIHVHAESGRTTSYALDESGAVPADYPLVPVPPVAGTKTITFHYLTKDSAEENLYALKAAALYLNQTHGLPVYLAPSLSDEGPTLLSASTFADKPLYQKELNTPHGIFTLSVVRNAPDLHNLNVRGRTRRLALEDRQPALEEDRTRPRVYSVLVDASQSADLARHYWEENDLNASDDALATLLREAALAVLYEYFATTPAITPSYRHWEEARRLGVAYPEPGPMGHPWTPTAQDQHPEPKKPVPYKPDDAIMPQDLSSPEQFLLDQAALFAKPAVTFIKPDPNLFGYSWNVKTPRLTGLAVKITLDGHTQTFSAQDEDYDDCDLHIEDVDTIRLIPDLRTPIASSHEQRVYPLGYAFTGLPKSYPACTLYLAKSATILPDDAARTLADAFFSPVSDADIDSPETQYLNFHQEALTAILHHTRTPEAAQKELLEHLIERHLRYALNPDLKVVITLQGKAASIDVQAMPAPTG